MDLHSGALQDVNSTDPKFPSLWKGFYSFDRHEQNQWFADNWTVSFYFVAAYIAFIYTGQEWMRNRKPLDLKKPIILWNTILAIFSIAACYRILPEFYSILAGKDGFHTSVCAPCQEVSDTGAYWGWLFTLSKILELGDTVFLILRKRKLIFLHWYHHITVLLYCWYVYPSQISPARWFICVNYSIHAMMYTYYALRSMSVPIPKKVAMTITSLQLSQMVVGVTVNVYAYFMKMKNVDCDVSFYHLNFGLIMYASYFVLFAHFFHKAYLQHGKDKERRAREKASAVADHNANLTPEKKSPTPLSTEIDRRVKVE